MSPLLAKGISIMRLKNYDEAIQVFDFCISISSRSFHSYFQKALALKELKKYTEAIQNFEISFDVKDK